MITASATKLRYNKLPCSKCSQLISTKRFKSHESICRPDGRCNICGEIKGKRGLKKHEKTCGKISKLACWCGKEFSDKTHLNRHKLVHKEK